MVYAREVWVVELRPGQYWVKVKEAKGTLTITPDPSRASTVAEGDAVLLPETLEMFPTARVVKIRVTVVEIPGDSRAS